MPLGQQLLLALTQFLCGLPHPTLFLVSTACLPVPYKPVSRCQPILQTLISQPRRDLALTLPCPHPAVLTGQQHLHGILRLLQASHLKPMCTSGAIGAEGSAFQRIGCRQRGLHLTKYKSAGKVASHCFIIGSQVRDSDVMPVLPYLPCPHLT
jgi:hypothetical protein